MDAIGTLPFAIEVAGQLKSARASLTPLYDSQNIKIRA